MTDTFTWDDAIVLVTGGTGSFGRKFTEVLLNDYRPKKLILFSRDELKQHEMRVAGFDDSRLRYFIGDVRDRSRLHRATNGVDVIVHAAALKQVPACEYNPMEAVKTNVDGARNVIDVALENGVQRVLALSTDKAVSPENLYGATKLVAEKLFIQGNSYRGDGPTRLSCARYGNVVGSRGSVVPLFQVQRQSGRITVTDKRMTRFWITLDQGVRFVIRAIEHMQGGELFVPKIPSTTILDLVDVIAPECDVEVTGIRPGEKLHETLLSDDEARRAIELEEMFVIEPAHSWWEQGRWEGSRVPEGFRYASDTNPVSLTRDEIAEMIETI